MKLTSCPACGGPAAIRSRTDSRRHCFHVWAQCQHCGMKTREFTDRQEPGENSSGGKWAAIAWNSGDYRQEAGA